MQRNDSMQVQDDGMQLDLGQMMSVLDDEDDEGLVVPQAPPLQSEYALPQRLAIATEGPMMTSCCCHHHIMV
jgi:hypothetical protein